MSTTVTYKGQTLTTVSNQTRKLETGGTYLEDDITLTDVTQVAPELQEKSVTYTPGTTAVTDTVTADSGYDGLSEVDVTVSAVPLMTLGDIGMASRFATVQGNRKWIANPYVQITAGGYATPGEIEWDEDFNALPANTTITPTESVQTVGGANYMMESALTVGAIHNRYVGSGIPRASGRTVTPTESSQFIVGEDTFVTGDIIVAAIDPDYVGSNVPRRASASLYGTADYKVVAPAGVYASDAELQIPYAPHNAPSIVVNDSGLITATHIHPNGSVSVGEDRLENYYQLTLGDDLEYGTSSCLVGTATVGTAYAWTDYQGDNIAVINHAVVGTDAVV